jgi:SAM-dependent methyltransferase
VKLVDYYRTNQVYGVEPDERMRRMLAVVKAKGAHRVLDVGCGRGLFPSELHRLGAQAYGIDVFDPDELLCDIRRVLGQGSRAQGHLKVFTHRSLAEILLYVARRS